MEARWRKDGDINIIHIFGHLTYEEVDQFSEVCNRLLDEKVIFNFDGLSFVGSSGITSFFAAIQNLTKRSRIRPKVCCLGIEFRKCLENYGSSDFEYYDSEFLAIKSCRVKEVFKEDMIGANYEQNQATGTEEPIGRAYPLGTTIDARPDSGQYPKQRIYDLVNKDD